MGTTGLGLTEAMQEPPHFPGRALYSRAGDSVESSGGVRGAVRGVTEPTTPLAPLLIPTRPPHGAEQGLGGRTGGLGTWSFFKRPRLSPWRGWAPLG